MCGPAAPSLNRRAFSSFFTIAEVAKNFAASKWGQKLAKQVNWAASDQNLPALRAATETAPAA